MLCTDIKPINWTCIVLVTMNRSLPSVQIKNSFCNKRLSLNKAHEITSNQEAKGRTQKWHLGLGEMDHDKPSKEPDSFVNPDCSK